MSINICEFDLVFFLVLYILIFAYMTAEVEEATADAFI